MAEAKLLTWGVSGGPRGVPAPLLGGAIKLEVSDYQIRAGDVLQIEVLEDRFLLVKTLVTLIMAAMLSKGV